MASPADTQITQCPPPIVPEDARGVAIYRIRLDLHGERPVVLGRVLAAIDAAGVDAAFTVTTEEDHLVVDAGGACPLAAQVEALRQCYAVDIDTCSSVAPHIPPVIVERIQA